MTARETTLLEKIREELHEYHTVVLRLADKQKSIEDTISKIVLDIYGNPEDRAGNPGALSNIAGGQRSWRTMRTGIRCLWGIVMVIVGTIISWLFR